MTGNAYQRIGFTCQVANGLQICLDAVTIARILIAQNHKADIFRMLPATQLTPQLFFQILLAFKNDKLPFMPCGNYWQNPLQHFFCRWFFEKKYQLHYGLAPPKKPCFHK